MLKSFAVKNYMSFGNDDYTTLTFEPDTNIIALFGINSSGKTNMLMAINTFMSYYKFHTASNVREYDEDKVRILDRNSFNPYGLKEECLTAPTFFKVVFMLDDKEYSFEYGYNASDIVFERLNCDELELYKKENDVIVVCSELTKLLKKDDKNIEGYKKELGDKQFFLSLLSFRNVDHFRLKEIDSYLKKIFLQFEDNIDEDDLVNDIKRSEIKLETLRKVLTKVDSSMVNIELKNEPDYEKIEIIRKDIANSRDKNLNKYLEKIIKELEEEDTIFVDAKNEDNGFTRLKFESLSEGTQKVLSLVSNLILSKKDRRVLLIDEIENKLNIFLMRYVLGLIKHLELQVVFTTHSLDILNYMDKEEIVFIKRKNGFNSVLETGNLANVKNIRDEYLDMELGYLPNID